MPEQTRTARTARDIRVTVGEVATATVENFKIATLRMEKASLERRLAELDADLAASRREATRQKRLREGSWQNVVDVAARRSEEAVTYRRWSVMRWLRLR